MVEARKYTFVTVAHEADWEMLRLQARSIRVHLPEHLASEIVVVDNSSSAMPAQFRDKLCAEYGDFAGRVRFLKAREIAEIPNHTTGWLSQQILKLMVSAMITTDRYVVLDAKNHLIFPLRRSFLEVGPKMRSCLTNYDRHSMRRFLENTLRYFGMNRAEYIQAFMPTVTPFTLPTAVVRELVQFIVEREKQPFPVAFLNRGFSEFFLFAAFIRVGGKADEMYDMSEIPCPGVWEHHAVAGARSLKRYIAEVEKCGPPFFGVHRRAVPWLDDKSRRIIADFWQRRRIVATTSEGLQFLSVTSNVKGQGSRRVYRVWKRRFLGLTTRMSKVGRRLRLGNFQL